MDDRKLTPKEVRKLIREEKITGQTSGLCPGYAQANLLILPKDQAYDFLYLHREIQEPAQYWK